MKFRWSGIGPGDAGTVVGMTTRPTVDALTRTLDEMLPERLAEPWDNTGLLVGVRAEPVEKVLLCIDLTSAVVEEALERGCDAVVAYHPPIFEPLKSLTDDRPGGGDLLALARAGVAVHSPHTSADAAVGGVNDWLLDRLGATSGRAMHPASSLPGSERFKIVTFTPKGTEAAVRSAAASAGAGRIGDYDHCSTEMPVTGRFRGGPGTSPVIGRPGRHEAVEEIRLELVCGSNELGDALDAVRRAHPYEEPPIEIHELSARPDPRVGTGRVATLDPGATTMELVERLRTGLSGGRFAVHDPSPRRRHRLVGVCAGSGGSLLQDAIDRGCTVFVTGELKHHDVLAAAAAGCSVILAGHTNTERGWLKVLRRRLLKALPGLEVEVSRRDRDPLRHA